MRARLSLTQQRSGPRSGGRVGHRGERPSCISQGEDLVACRGHSGAHYCRWRHVAGVGLRGLHCSMLYDVHRSKTNARKTNERSGGGRGHLRHNHRGRSSPLQAGQAVGARSSSRLDVGEGYSADPHVSLYQDRSVSGCSGSLALSLEMHAFNCLPTVFGSARMFESDIYASLEV